MESPRILIKKIKKKTKDPRTRVKLPHVDPRAEEFRLLNLRRRAPAMYPPPPPPRVINFPKPGGREVPPRLQIWRKEFYSSYVENQRKIAAQQYKPSYFSNIQDDDVDHDRSKVEYRTIGDFWKLSEMERVETNDYQRDLSRYLRDKELTDVCIPPF